jgi:hypothetical protein
MIKLTLYSAVASAWLVLGFAAPAQAQALAAFVSGHGTDAAGCKSVANPCRTLQYVHDNVIAAGGSIEILDGAGYGPVTITKALSIINDGAGVAAVQQVTAGLNAITINAGATDAIILKGLQIEGFGVATNGIQFTAGASLGISGSNISGFTGTGVNFTPSVGSSSTLTVTGSGVFLNGLADITIAPAAGTGASATLKSCDVSGAPTGVTSDGTAGPVHTTISDCVIHNIGAVAVEAKGAVGPVHVMVERTDMAHVGTALSSDSAVAQIALNDSTIAHVTTVYAATLGGLLDTFQNNAIFYETTLGATPTNTFLQ